MPAATTESLPTGDSDAPDTELRATLWRIAPVVLQLALAILVVRQFQLESDTFHRVFLVAGVGFIAHSLLPMRHRLTFFVLLSVIAILVALGVRDGMWLLVAGTAIIGICHLPLPFGARVALVLVAGTVLAVARVGMIPVPWSEAVWPILGSMFMFRLAVYMYAQRFDPTPPTWRRTFAYFFMIPNMAYPLFPVVDYGTMGRTYYEGDEEEIYQRGMQWIARGLLHLLLYRVVYLHLTLDATNVTDIGGLVRFMVSTFLLYLRVSGQFHIAVGVLHLFGFRLPETHRLYYLASSFTDFWRRINIYWKDFMMKLVYYPSYFRLRRFGDKTALIVATGIVFISTWLLHSYQWFWLQGQFPLTAPDGLFWGVLGLMVIVATLREMKRGRKRTLARRTTFDARLALRTTGLFCAMCVLWSLWSTDSVMEWLWVWSAAGRADAKDIIIIAGLLAGFFFLAGRVWDAPVLAHKGSLPLWRRPALQTSTMLLAILLIGQPAVYERAGPQLAGVVGSVRTNSLNAADQERQFRGYYEKLDNEGRLADAMRTETPVAPTTGWEALVFTKASHRRGDFLQHDIVPNSSIVFKGAPLTSNRWGMRDRDYTLEKAPDVKRIAILGHSVTMGTGVADAEVWDEVAEQKLSEAAGATEYELMNFGVAGYSLVQQMALMEERVFRFQPDIVAISIPAEAHLRQHLVAHLIRYSHSNDVAIPYAELERMLADAGLDDGAGQGVAVPYRRLRALARQLGIQAVMPEVEANARINPILDDIVVWALRRTAETIRANGAIPVLLAMDDVQVPSTAEVPFEQAARESGFVVFNLFDAYRGQDLETLRIAPWDEHPNAAAHRLLADRFLAELQKMEPF